ncbi:C45 family autoproteolytic acyltransferase/hydolase [Candidatus Solincola tengchongensis]|uniref:C45 family autoproteolytic acyltransferase/hydolase n=1 Tax=Candidatus Solincola tengchongensis TaxID=2900693 RepID=UPI00257DC348|nr:C45 family autoproteolytic acyltransferase/hydolase [Candidatus Solincola tengchongensis]
MLWAITSRDEFGFGYAAGREREALYRAALSRTAVWLRRSGAQPGRVRETARRHLDLLADRYPAQRERLTGLASALGVEAAEVAAAALTLASLPGTGCTNFAAVPPATGDGKVYVSWNFDLSPLFRLLMGRIPLYVRDVAGAKPYVCLGLPVLFGIGVMNSDGLSACVNSVGSMDGGEGLTFFELNNLAMETQSTVDGAVGVWRDNPREVLPGLAMAILMNANCIFADMGGDAAVIEYSHRYMAVEKAADHGGVLASANHYQFLDRELAGGADPRREKVIAGSFARLARMWELLEMFRGRIDRETARIITRDHGLNYSALAEFGMDRSPYEERVDDATICCHPWNFFRHLRRGEILDALVEMNIARTLNSIIMDPGRCTIYITPGNPCRHQYVPVWVGDALRMEWADRAREEIDYSPQWRPRTLTKRGGVFRRPRATKASDWARSLGLRFFGALDRLISAGLVEE